MGQQEVYDFLKKNKGEWFTSRQIAGKMRVSIGSVTCNLTKLRNSKSIFYRISDKRSNMYLYKFERNADK
ncbi:MAG: hypothetical protein ABIJ34_04245 [archaeon]